MGYSPTSYSHVEIMQLLSVDVELDPKQQFLVDLMSPQAPLQTMESQSLLAFEENNEQQSREVQQELEQEQMVDPESLALQNEMLVVEQQAALQSLASEQKCLQLLQNVIAECDRVRCCFEHKLTLGPFYKLVLDYHHAQ